MKILLINSIFPPYARGGAETVAATVATSLGEMHEVVVVSCAPWEGWNSLAGKLEYKQIATDTKQDSHGITDPVISGNPSTSVAIRIFRFTPFNLFSIFNIAKYPPLLRLIWHVIDMFNLHTFFVMRQILQQEKPDLILTHNLKGLGYTIPLAIRHYQHVIASAATATAGQAKQSHGQGAEIATSPKAPRDDRFVRWFHTLHDMALLHPSGLRIWGQENTLMQKNVLVRLYAWCTKKLFGSPDVVISPSQFLLGEHVAQGFFPASRKEVVRNPITHNPPQPSLTLREGADANTPLRVRGDRGVTRFLYLGQLEPYKGVRVLLEAWRTFSAKHKNVELVIVGKGSREEEVTQATKQFARLRYLGFVPHENLASVFDGVVCTLLPTLAYENAPTSIVESFNAGVPVIASRIGGISELIKEGETGFLVTPGSVTELAEAMETMLTYPLEHFNTALARASQEYSTEQYQNLIMKMLS